MSSNTNAKVNPFYLDEEEDPWDDDYGDDEYGDEQVGLINGNGSNNNSNRKYNVSDTFPKNFSSNYHDGRYEVNDRHRQHIPQLWKYGFLFVTIIAVIAFGSSLNENEGDKVNGGDMSLIDESRNDEYRIVVLGERHSGTDWMRDRLRECFPHADVSSDLQRMGYFFQDDEATARSKEEILLLGNKNNEEKNPQPNSKNYPDTIVVHVTLNAYDWLEQMRLSPEYAPDHVGKHQDLGHVVPLEWEEFLSKPWTTERPQTDLPLANESGPVCQMGFHYNEVVSCAGTEGGIGNPMYELRQEGNDGHPFESIIDLRTAKLKNHHSVLEAWPSVKKMVQVPYETLAQDFKTELLSEILEFTGWNGGSYDSNGASLPCSGNVLPPSLDSSNAMTPAFVDYVTEHTDWEIEKNVASYEPWTENEINAKGIRPVTKVSPPPPANEGSSVDKDPTAGMANNPGNNNKQEAKEKEGKTTTSSDQSSPLSSNESSEKSPEINAEDEPKETKANEDSPETSSSYSSSSSSSTKQKVNGDQKSAGSNAINDNSVLVSATEGGSPTSVSSSKNKLKEEAVDIESTTTSAKKEPSTEKVSESSMINGEESTAGSEENSNEVETLKEQVSPSIDSTAPASNASDEKEEEQLSSVTSLSSGEEETVASAATTTTTTTTTPNTDGASPQEESDAVAVIVTESEIARKEEPPIVEKETLPIDDSTNAKPNEENLMIKKNEGNTKDEAAQPSESTSKEKEENTNSETAQEEETPSVVQKETPTDDKANTKPNKENLTVEKNEGNNEDEAAPPPKTISEEKKENTNGENNNKNEKKSENEEEKETESDSNGDGKRKLEAGHAADDTKSETNGNNRNQ